MKKKRPEPLFLFYILVAYIILQFVWWSYLLSSLSGEVYTHKEAELRVRISDPALLQSELALVKKKQYSRLAMIVGEGSVFLLLLGLGIYRVNRSFKKESELSSRQRNFMLSVTHELKSPLAAIKLNLQTLQKHKLDEEVKNQVIVNAIQEADRLNQLLENVLLASRMESAGLMFMEERVDLSTLLENIISVTFSTSGIKKEIEPGVIVTADRNALVSLFSNIIENALKYGNNDVMVKLYRRDSRACVDVSDMGPGIPDSEKQRIFEKFYRLGNEETRRSKGTGLGLFIVKYIADKTGIQVQVMDNEPAGTLFRILFP